MLTVSPATPSALPFVPNPMGDGFAPVSPYSNRAMIRACKPKKIVYKGVDHTYMQPGWYDLETGFAVFTEADHDIERRMIQVLRGRVDGKEATQ